MGEKEWAVAISVAPGGDRCVAVNGFWAALNIAATLKLPILFFIGDNAFGLAVPSSLQTPSGNIAADLASFGNLRLSGNDGADPTEAAEAIAAAVRYVRGGNGPAGLQKRCVDRGRKDARPGAAAAKTLLAGELARHP